MKPATAHEKLNTKAAGIIGLAVMCSRVLGLIREVIFAGLFGAGWAMDAFNTAFRIPNLLRDLFAEGALSTAFVTTFSKTQVLEGEQGSWRLANKVLTLTTVTLSSITLLGMLLTHWAISQLGFSPQQAALATTLTHIMFPFILLVSLAALVMGMLNSRNVFGVPAMASSFFNLGSIVGGTLIGYWIDPAFGPRALIGMAVGTLIGGGLQLAVQLPSLAKLGYVFKPDFHWRDAGIKSILSLMGPSVIAASSTQINVLVNTTFASYLAAGSISWLNYAFRLMQLPLGLFGVALGTVSLPLLARMAAAGNTDGFRSELARSLRLGFLLTIPATIGLMMLAEPIISLIYQHGAFGAYETTQAAGALRFYAVGLCGYAALKVLVNAFYAVGQRKTPMMVSFLAVGLNLLLNWLFTFQLGWGHRGLAFSTGCIAAINFSILYYLMHRHLQRLETTELLKLVGKALLASAVLVAICWAGQHWLFADWATMRFVWKVLALLATITIAGSGFFISAWLMRIPELDLLVAALRRRLTRRKA